MDSPSVTQEHTSSVDSESDAIAKLQDLIPELDSKYDILRSIGCGTFSRVYLAKLKSSSKSTSLMTNRFAIKHIIPTSHPSRVLMELQCLYKLGGLNNVIGVSACHRHLNHIALVMPFIPHDSTSDYMGCLSVSEVRDYLANLLSAVMHVHRHHILHRDIKPANFLYHRATNRYCLVDFGLAQEINSKTGVPSSKLQPTAPPPRPPTPLPPTPHIYTSRPVKRKLPVDMATAELSVSSNKRAKVSSPLPPPHNVLTAAASRLNASHPHLAAGVRRSPRKCPLRSPSKKENYGTVTLEASNDLHNKALATTPQKTPAAASPRKHVVKKMNLSPLESNTQGSTPFVGAATRASLSPDASNTATRKVAVNGAGGVTPRKRKAAGCVTPQKKTGGGVTPHKKTLVGVVTPQKKTVLGVVTPQKKTRLGGVTPQKKAGGGVTPKKNMGDDVTPKKKSGVFVTPQKKAVGCGVVVTPSSVFDPPPPSKTTPHTAAYRTAGLARWQPDSPSKHTRLAEASLRRDMQQPSSSESGSGPSVRLSGPPPKIKNTRHCRVSSAEKPGCGDGKRTPPDTGAQGGQLSLVESKAPGTVCTSSRLVSLTRPSDAFTSTTTTTGLLDLGKRTSCVNDTKNDNQSKPLLSAGSSSAVCRCYGKGQICKKCQARPAQVAARAGTPGFRPPEVLLRHPRQDAAVDIWACGVVGMCLLSGRHPFFRAPDDQTALAELCTLFSTKAIRKTAAALDKLFVSNIDRPPLDLMKVCEGLRLSCVPDGAGTTIADQRLKQPCPTCQQPRLCVCKEDAPPLDIMRTESADVKRELDWETGRVDSTNSPTIDYLKNLTKKNGVASPMRTTRVNTNTPLTVKKESADVEDCNPSIKVGVESLSKDKTTLSSTEQSKVVIPPQCDPPRTPTRPLPPPFGSPSCPPKGGGEKASPNRRVRPPLYAARYPGSLYDLLGRLLELHPTARITAEQALNHPFLKGARINSSTK